MSYFLSSLPLWEMTALLVVLPTLLAMGLQALIQRWVGPEKLVQNNEIAGFKFATVGVIYAVLLAFAVIVAWEKFNEGENAVAQEAAAAAALLRYAEGGEPEAVAFRADIANYLKLAIEKDWPAMATASENHDATRALDHLYHQAMALNGTGARDTADMSEVFAQLDNLTAHRRVRLHLATGLVPNVIWIALFTGALLTVGFPLFFGSRNQLAQIAMTGVLSTLVTLGLIVIVSLDHPFTGPVYIHPDPLVDVLSDFTREQRMSPLPSLHEDKGRALPQ
jgi:hypothetical protein